MSDLTVRPSRQAYEASWPTRKKQALGLGGGALVSLFLTVVVGIARRPSNALLILILLLLGLAGLAGVGFFAIDFAYLRNATITVAAAGLRLSGVPLARTRTSPAPARFERATLDFGRGVQRRVWLAVDPSGRPSFWTYADFWDESSIDQLAKAIGASVSGDWSAVIAKPAAPRW